MEEFLCIDVKRQSQSIITSSSFLKLSEFPTCMLNVGALAQNRHKGVRGRNCCEIPSNYRSSRTAAFHVGLNACIYS